MKRILPHPILALALLLFWMTLTSFSLGHLALGTLVAIVAGRLMALLEPQVPRIKRWDLVVKLALITAWDILISNLQVARLILMGDKRSERHSDFLVMDIPLREPLALGWLAVIVTATPGTAWVLWDPDKGRLTLHIFDLKDPEHWRKLIKTRYAAPLKEIFE